MSLQARMSEGDKRLYNPSRDVAHNFKEVLSLVASRLEDEKWPELAELLHRENVSMDDLGEACACYCRYVAYGAEDPKKPMQESLIDCGFFKCKPAAQIAVMAMIGVCYAGIQHVGIREATIGNEGPLLSVKELTQVADNLLKFTGKSRLMKFLFSFKMKVKKAFRVLTEKN